MARGAVQVTAEGEGGGAVDKENRGPGCILL